MLGARIRGNCRILTLWAIATGGVVLAGAGAQEVKAPIGSVPSEPGATVTLTASAESGDGQSQASAPPEATVAQQSPMPSPVRSATPKGPVAPAIQTQAGQAASLQKDRGVPVDYVIGSGDTLQISVWKEPDASVPSVVVRPDGRIAMPLLKEVEVAGLTPGQLEKAITEKLSSLINSPDVTVVVTSINSKKIYVMGGARREGAIPYTYRMTVMQALSEAGGLTDYAKRKKIYVLRTENGENQRFRFNYDEVIKGQKMDQNIQLVPGDTLVVPH